MNRMKVIRMAALFALIAGPLAAWLAPAAFAQGGALAGTVFDMTGKPYPDVTISIKNIETNKQIDAVSDAKGHYSAPGLGAGTYNIDVKGKDKDQKEMLLYQTGIKLAAGAIPTFDINLKELQEQGKLAAIEAIRKQQEAEVQFQALKTHYDAGIAAIEQMKAAQTKLAQTPKEQQDPVKAQITTAGGTAVTELSAALELEKPVFIGVLQATHLDGPGFASIASIPPCEHPSPIRFALCQLRLKRLLRPRPSAHRSMNL